MVEITPEHQRFIADQIACGAFRQPDEVVFAALEFFQAAESDYMETVQDIRQGQEAIAGEYGRSVAGAIDHIRQRLGLLPG